MEAQELAAVMGANEGRIRAYIARMIDDADEAADLAQETFVRAHAAKDTFRGESKITTWLYSIATNVCLDYLKRAAHRRLEVTPPERLADVPEVGEAEGEVRLSAALLLDRADMGQCVRRFIDELPGEQRMALLLHDIEGMTNPEVAAALDCSVATAKIRVHRARKKLRDILEQQCTFTRDARGVFVCEPKPSTDKSPS